jgi:hypothetical protein
LNEFLNSALRVVAEDAVDAAAVVVAVALLLLTAVL